MIIENLKGMNGNQLKKTNSNTISLTNYQPRSDIEVIIYPGKITG